MGNSQGKKNKNKDGAAPAAKAAREGRKSDASKTEGPSGDVREKYRVDHNELGHGHYGVVRKCQNRVTKEFFAVKTIKKAKVGRLETLKREIEILKTMDHPNIIKLVDVFEDDKYLHLVTELCTGGELFDRIIEKTKSAEGHYSEQDAANLIKDVLSALEYVHTVHNISHRDLKPENFLFATPAEDSPLKIIDFGLSRYDDEIGHMSTKVGTPYYIAPEVLTRHYDKECDLWSVGVVAYVLLCGYPPFYGDTDAEIFASVKRGEFDFPSPDWDDISASAKQFIRRLLQVDPSKRPTAREALEHPWFAEAKGGAGTTKAQVMVGIKGSLERFIGMNKLKRSALTIIAEQLTQAEIAGLKAAFDSMDTNRDGKLTYAELEEALEQEGYDGLKDELRNVMAGLDLSDQNAEIEYSEFLAATMDMNHAIREENILRAFQVFDKKGTGVISFAELTKIMGSEEHAREVAGEIDLNGDGVISYEEFKAMMQGLNSHSNRYQALMDSAAHSNADASLASMADEKLSVRDSAPAKSAKAGFFSRSAKK